MERSFCSFTVFYFFIGSPYVIQAELELVRIPPSATVIITPDLNMILLQRPGSCIATESLYLSKKVVSS